MRLKDLVAVLEELAPTTEAEAWDNVGLLVGDPAQAVTRVLLTIDYTAAVADEAYARRCDGVVSYHPPIFQALKRIDASSVVFQAIQRGIALYSPHTALDVVEGGTNDVLADVIGMTDRAPLRRATQKDAYYKLVTFVPNSSVEAVSNALFDAGAGRIGRYTSCSFRTPGTGTFFGEDGARPAAGVSGKHEEVSELRLETRVPLVCADAVIRALRRAHPYEEPAFDLVRLAASPEHDRVAGASSMRGMGRVGKITPMDRREVIDRIKTGLAVEKVLVAGPSAGTITRAAVAAGAGGDLYRDALAARAELYVTGEMRHHDALACAAGGMTVVCTLHSNSERVALGALERKLRAKTIPLEVLQSQADRDPFAFV